MAFVYTANDSASEAVLSFARSLKKAMQDSHQTLKPFANEGSNRRKEHILA